MVRIMADNHTKEIRSMNMSHIRSKDTKPEVIVRSFLHKNGFRFRKNDKRYPGKPDIVLPRYKTAVYVNGICIAVIILFGLNQMLNIGQANLQITETEI